MNNQSMERLRISIRHHEADRISIPTQKLSFISCVLMPWKKLRIRGLELSKNSFWYVASFLFLLFKMLKLSRAKSSLGEHLICQTTYSTSVMLSYPVQAWTFVSEHLYDILSINFIVVVFRFQSKCSLTSHSVAIC